ncbi:hypothetical protein [Arundinibacter roseus]|uniref:Uncharacterized protein n=1 Tax=Arundinibacter roseus TaxID=2070510 RepID=A0A4R4K8F3_9BACT|nr:hypothetical protein [Arundinibacter roseus]TDB63693.1 hypothetical protein EZE20_15460 [Arundinibacter roseus]
MDNSTFKNIEPQDQVPDYLKKALVSEIDMIRDTLEVVSLFTITFFDTALLCIPDETHANPQ